MNIPRFIEEQPFEKGFESFFETRLASIWQEMEEHRVRILKRSRICLALILAVALAVFYMSSYSPMAFPLTFLIILLGTVAVIVNHSYHLNLYSALFKQKMLPIFFKFFGDFEYSPSNSEAPKLKILPFHSRSEVSDCIQGEYEELSFSLQELKLYEINLFFIFYAPHIIGLYLLSGKIMDKPINATRLIEKVCSQGLLMTVNFPREFKGETLVFKDKQDQLSNWAKKLTDPNLSKVDLEDPEFEAKFEIYSTDQVEARYLLTTALIQRLLDLTEHLKSKPMDSPKLRAEFRENKMVLYLNTSYNSFEPRSLKNKFNEFKELHLFLEQMNQIFEFLHLLKLNRL